ncbi:hypothetical protein EDC01DRAFT_480247 [Geopyxis carbonaria]|nr:hypothetical protein EDC01DRAFT_480247 [Geopyxis carbonaria]
MTSRSQYHERNNHHRHHRATGADSTHTRRDRHQSYHAEVPSTYHTYPNEYNHDRHHRAADPTHTRRDRHQSYHAEVPSTYHTYPNEYNHDIPDAQYTSNTFWYCDSCGKYNFVPNPCGKCHTNMGQLYYGGGSPEEGTSDKKEYQPEPAPLGAQDSYFGSVRYKPPEYAALGRQTSNSQEPQHGYPYPQETVRVPGKSPTVLRYCKKYAM